LHRSRAGQTELGKELRGGGPDVRGRGGKLPLGSTDIGSTAQQLRRKTNRHDWRRVRLREPGRVADLLPRPSRRPAHPPERTPERTPERS
jgi:hypothetical protein